MQYPYFDRHSYSNDVIDCMPPPHFLASSSQTLPDQQPHPQSFPPSFALASKKKKNANVLQLKLPGFDNPINVPFPDRRLPVCERCKKNFKTREHCRTRDCHTTLPWCDTYICVTLGSNCTRSGVGGEKLLQGPFVVKSLPPIPFFLEGEKIDPLTPICLSCKDKNYTRTYCRSNKKHRQLPWSAVHILLTKTSTAVTTSQDNKDNNGTQEQEERPTKRTKISEVNGVSTAADANAADTNTPETQGDAKKKNEEEGKEGKGNEVDPTKNETKNANENIFDIIPKSRTFLVTVSAKNCAIEWLGFDPKIEAIVAQLEDELGIATRMPDYPPAMYGGGVVGGGMMMPPYNSNQTPMKEGVAGGSDQSNFNGSYNSMMSSQYSRMAAAAAYYGARGGGGPYPQDMMMLQGGIPRNGGGGGEMMPSSQGNANGNNMPFDNGYYQQQQQQAVQGVPPWAGGGGGGGGGSIYHQ